MNSSKRQSNNISLVLARLSRIMHQNILKCIALLGLAFVTSVVAGSITWTFEHGTTLPKQEIWSYIGIGILEFLVLFILIAVSIYVLHKFNIWLKSHYRNA